MSKRQFEIGETVFLKTDVDQRERLVVGIVTRCDSVRYALAYGTGESWHDFIEISKEKDILKATTN